MERSRTHRRDEHHLSFPLYKSVFSLLLKLMVLIIDYFILFLYKTERLRVSAVGYSGLNCGVSSSLAFSCFVLK